jgi:hypothetical protein
MRAGISGLPGTWVLPHPFNPNATERNTPSYHRLDQDQKFKSSLVKVEMNAVSLALSRMIEKYE